MATVAILTPLLLLATVATGQSAPLEEPVEGIDVREGPASSDPMYVTPLGSRVVFQADDGLHGPELWISDGSASGTELLADIRPGPDGSSPVPGGELGLNPVPTDARSRFTQVGDALYFVADDGVHGREIWRTDGTTEGTRLLADVTEGPAEWSIASYLTAHAGSLYFMGDDGFDGEELWVSDGTEDGTRLLADLLPGPPGGRPTHLTSTPVGLTFSAEHEELGIEPWVTDGTADGTRLLRDIAEGGAGSGPSSFAPLGGRAFLFAASDAPDQANAEPWISDGTPGGTRLLDDVNSTGSGFKAGFVAYGAGAVFAADDGTAGSEPWFTDGTAAGTRRIANVGSGGIGSDPAEFAAFGDLLFFSGFDFPVGIEPWVSDGTEEGTRLLLDLNPGSVPSSLPRDATVIGERLVFSAQHEETGRELWSTDGTSDGTRLIADIQPGTDGSEPVFLAVASDGTLYFAAHGAGIGRELHVLRDDAGTSPSPTATDGLPRTPQPSASPTVDRPTPSPTHEATTSPPDAPRIFIPDARRP